MLERALPGAEAGCSWASRDELSRLPGQIRSISWWRVGSGLPPLYMQAALRRPGCASIRSEMLYGGRGRHGPGPAARDGGDGRSRCTSRPRTGPSGRRAWSPRRSRPGSSIAPAPRDARRCASWGAGPTRCCGRSPAWPATEASPASFRSKSRWPAASASASAAPSRPARAPFATSAATARCSTPPTSSTSAAPTARRPHPPECPA